MAENKANERAEEEARWAAEMSEYETRKAIALSEWERTCSLPQSKEVGFKLVSIWYSCSLVCLT